MLSPQKLSFHLRTPGLFNALRRGCQSYYRRRWRVDGAPKLQCRFHLPKPDSSHGEWASH
jgi:hypothetical protein